jgi:hypothetical protein
LILAQRLVDGQPFGFTADVHVQHGERGEAQHLTGAR